ncbi:uncharacterized protein [Oryctolagus cuniculus]|uniref:uncharacterized protein n=1 Tax=Oryctolagus cuniculus TaxID=9986 RepID=UPI003878FF0B
MWMCRRPGLTVKAAERREAGIRTQGSSVRPADPRSRATSNTGLPSAEHWAPLRAAAPERSGPAGRVRCGSAGGGSAGGGGRSALPARARGEARARRPSVRLRSAPRSSLLSGPSPPLGPAGGSHPARI